MFNRLWNCQTVFQIGSTISRCHTHPFLPPPWAAQPVFASCLGGGGKMRQAERRNKWMFLTFISKSPREPVKTPMIDKRDWREDFPPSTPPHPSSHKEKFTPEMERKRETGEKTESCSYWVQKVVVGWTACFSWKDFLYSESLADVSAPSMARRAESSAARGADTERPGWQKWGPLTVTAQVRTPRLSPHTLDLHKPPGISSWKKWKEKPKLLKINFSCPAKYNFKIKINLSFHKVKKAYVLRLWTEISTHHIRFRKITKEVNSQ